jgi:hypothetical protein
VAGRDAGAGMMALSPCTSTYRMGANFDALARDLVQP